jgi:signal-transduction protein with cAMP-binding, CBS, and nucleotidyltransferase domain
MFFIVKGRVELFYSKSNKSCRRLDSGDLFGHRGLIGRKSHFTYRALSSVVTCFYITNQDLNHLIFDKYLEIPFYKVLNEIDESYNELTAIEKMLEKQRQTEEYRLRAKREAEAQKTREFNRQKKVIESAENDEPSFEFYEDDAGLYRIANHGKYQGSRNLSEAYNLLQCNLL